MTWLYNIPRRTRRYAGISDPESTRSIDAAGILRAREKQVLLQDDDDLVSAEPLDLMDYVEDGPPEHTLGALPEWAEELRGCDLPQCPVCALAYRGYYV